MYIKKFYNKIVNKFELNLNKKELTELYPFFVIEFPNGDVIRSKSMPFYDKNNLNYIWDDTIKYKFYCENINILNIGFLMIELYSNKSNTISGAIFLGEIEIDFRNLCLGPKLHECTLLHGIDNGNLLFNIECIEYSLIEINIHSITLSDIDIYDKRLFLTYYLSSGEKKQKYNTEEFSPSVNENNKLWKIESKNNMSIQDCVSYNDICESDGLIIILKSSNMFLTSKIGQCNVVLKDLWLNDNITTDVELKTNSGKVYTLTISLSINNPPRYIQSITGKHQSTLTEHIYTDVENIDGSYKLNSDTSYINCSDTLCEPDNIPKTLTFSPLQFNLKCINKNIFSNKNKYNIKNTCRFIIFTI